MGPLGRRLQGLSLASAWMLSAFGPSCPCSPSHPSLALRHVCRGHEGLCEGAATWDGGPSSPAMGGAAAERASPRGLQLWLLLGPLSPLLCPAASAPLTRRSLRSYGPLSPSPDTLSGRRSCSALPAPPPGLVTQELLTLQPDGDFLLTPEPRLCVTGSLCPGQHPWSPAVQSSRHSLGSLWPQHRPLQRPGNQAQRRHLIYS